MSSPDILFKGIPRSATRGYTAQVLRAVKPAQVVIPCTGSFSLAFVAREAGVAAERIVCGDISLYSTALGKAFMDEDWRLELKADNAYAEAIKPFLSDPITKAAAVLLLVRILQYDRKEQKAYHAHRQRELMRNAGAYIEQLQEQIIALRALLKGITYVPQDMWVTMDDYLDGEDEVNLINPPRYTGGYERMFAGVDAIFDWDEPQAAQFVERDYERLMDMLKTKPALSLMYYATDGPDPAPQWGDPWKAVFADRPGSIGRSAINWIIANREPVGVAASRSGLHQGEARYRQFNGEVRAESKLWAVRMDKPTGDYYRDLFIHKLPGSQTEVYVGLLLDGCLMGIVGLHLADLRRGKVITKGDKVLDHCASVTFAFTTPHEGYRRLHKLTLMSIASDWFWDDVLGAENWYELNGAPKHVKTTMLTQHPENKTARGIMKLDTREQQPDGSYKLTYSTEVKQQTREETVAVWRSKYGTLTR